MDKPLEHPKCPSCGSEDFHRSRSRSRRERLLRLISPYQYYRCRGCDWRGPRANRMTWLEWRYRALNSVGPVLVLAVVIWLVSRLVAERTRPVQRARPAAPGRAAQ